MDNTQWMTFILAISGLGFTFFQILYALFMKNIKDDVCEIKKDFRGIANALNDHIKDHAIGKFDKVI